MLTEGIVPPPEVSENFGLSGLLLLKAIVSAVEGLEGLPKLSWLWMVIGPPVGLEVAEKFNAELVKTSLLAAPGLTVIRSEERGVGRELTDEVMRVDAA